MNLGTAPFERDLVHRPLHEVDTAAMFRFKIFDSRGIRNGSRIKPLALVWYDQRDSVPDFATAADVNQFASIQPVTVNDCVAQSFAQRQFNDSSMSRIKRSTSGEMALTSLGIQASTLSKLPPCLVLSKCARKSVRPFRTSIWDMMNSRLQPRASHRPKRTES
jgi:hypothetical protein